MAQIWPANDAFTEEATPYGDYATGYARLLPWSSDTGSGDSIVADVGDLTSAYFTQAATLNGNTIVNVTSPTRRAAVWNSSSALKSSFFVWRPFFATRGQAKLAFQWAYVSAGATVADFRFAFVCTRVEGQSINNTSGQERLVNGNGYFLVCRNVASQPGLKFYLLRVNAGTVTKLAETTAVNVSTLNLNRGMWMSILASTSGGNVIIRCRRGPLGLEAVDGGGEVNIFGADITDSSGSKLLNAGRCGFGLAKPQAGSAALAHWFEVYDPVSQQVVFRDEWERSNYLVGDAVAADNNGKAGRNLIPWYGGSVGGREGNAGFALRDSGNNRLRNHTSNAVASAFTLNMPSAVRASHEAVQRRSLDVTWATASGRVDKVQIELRGTALHAPTSSLAKCYRLEVECNGTGPAWTYRLISIIGGVATTLATKTAAIAVTTHTIDFDVQNVGGLTPFDGDPNLVFRLNGSGQTGWTLAGVAGVEQLSNGTIVDRRSNAIRRGWEQGWRYVGTPQSGTPTAMRFDAWTDSAAPPDSGDNNIPSASVSTETAGATGTLTVPVSTNITQTRVRPSVLHRYDSDHVQALALGSRERRRWALENPAGKETEKDDLLTFWGSHKGSEIPFSWVTDDGDTATVRFIQDSLDVEQIDANVWRYAFELEELFA